MSLEQSTFGLLVRLPSFIQMRKLLVSRLRGHISNLFSTSTSRHVFQFCFLVDNSGSMGGDIGRQVRTALVLAMEVLRRLECEFSIIRFGETPLVLKKIDTPLTLETGQVILEGFSFDEGTNVLGGVRHALQHGFTRTPPRVFSPDTVVHRCVLTLTDGFVPANELARREYQAMLSVTSPGNDISICMLALTDDDTRSMTETIMASMHMLTGGRAVRRLRQMCLTCYCSCVQPYTSAGPCVSCILTEAQFNTCCQRACFCGMHCFCFRTKPLRRTSRLRSSRLECLHLRPQTARVPCFTPCKSFWCCSS